MAKQSKQSNGGSAVLEDLPLDELKDQAWELVAALGERAVAATTDKVGGLTGKLVEAANGSGGSSGSGGGSGSLVGNLLGAGASTVKDKVKDKLTGGSDGDSGGSHGGDKSKLTNIIEQIEVGVPVKVAYNQWTQFQDFPKFTKRIESVSQESEEEVTWKAGIYFSHRTWRSTIIEQIPDEHIVWHSEGDKGYVDGTVTFHELTPDLTKIIVVLEYHAQGLFERTGNMFRVQRRRARLELNHFARHVMTQTILDQDVEGWRGEIRDSEVVRSHEEAMEEEDSEYDEDEGDVDEDEYEDELEDEGEPEDDEDEDEPEDDYEDEFEDEDEPEDEPEDEFEDEDEPEDEFEDEDEPEDEPEDDEDDEEARARTAKRGRRRQPARSR